MKKVTKYFMAALLAGMCVLGYAQDYSGAPKPNEKVIATVTARVECGLITYVRNHGFKNPPSDINTLRYFSREELYQVLLNKAIEEYGTDYPRLKLRNMKTTDHNNYTSDRVGTNRRYYDIGITKFWQNISASVVIDLKEEAYENISNVLGKALSGVRSGSKIAIDALVVSNGDDREEYKDFVISNLLDKGYKVVAKEYLERLYEEQLNQQSGIYNENTVVMENNFSAVGYYLNLNVTESFIRAQVVNVSTGEYEGNVIESLNPSGSNTDDNGSLSKALTRGLNNVRMGSKVAIDGVIVPNGTDKEYFKDQIINLLLNNGYKVVAKEYLERLYNEQQDQLSGIYNESTTVQENNFSAVGYFINVKLTETSVRVQVVNVSTGEYEGNATVNF